MSDQRPNPGYEAFHAPRFAFVLELLHRRVRPPGTRILDIGRSPLTAHLATQLRVPVDSLGLEPDGELPHGRHRRFDLNDTRDRGRWRLDLGPYDVVVFAEVLEHLHTAPELVLAYLRALLVPGGLLVLQTPNAAALGKRLKLLAGFNPFERLRPDPENPGHVREYTAREIRELLTGGGFAVEGLWTRFYFDARHARHERGDEPPAEAVGTVKNVLYRLLPPFLREGITALAVRVD
jgi:SAM-dependent methyltransferase